MIAYDRYHWTCVERIRTSTCIGNLNREVIVGIGKGLDSYYRGE